MEAIDQAIDQVKAAAGILPTPTLCEALRVLDGAPPALMSVTDWLTRGLLMEILTDRHPEANDALNAWAATRATAGAVQALTSAAIAAAETGALAEVLVAATAAAAASHEWWEE